MNPYEQVMDANRTSLEASVKLAAKSLESANRVFQQSLDLATTMASESAELLKRIQVDSRDPGELLAELEKGRVFCGRQLERCAALWRESVDAGMETQSELARIIQNNLANAARAATLASAALTAGAEPEAREQPAPAKRGRAGTLHQ